MTKTPKPLLLDYDCNDLYCQALREESTRGHHSKCLFGNLAKTAGYLAAAAGDPNWRAPRAKFMPEKGVVRFDYGDSRYEQELTRGQVAWLDKFDAGAGVRSLRILLDPNGRHTKYVYQVGSRSGGAHLPPPPMTAKAAKVGKAGKAATRGSKTASVTTDVTDHMAAGESKPAKNYGGPDGKGHTTVGCDTNMAPNSGRAHRMRTLNRQRAEAEARRRNLARAGG